MQYELKIVKIDDPKIGDKIEIQEGSLVLKAITSSEQGYIYDPNKPCHTLNIEMLVPVLEEDTKGG